MPPKKKKVSEVPKGPSLFPQPSRPRPLASQLIKSAHVDNQASGGGSTTPAAGRSPARAETPPRSPLHGERVSGGGGGDAGGGPHQSQLLPESVCTVLATPLNDNELDVPSLTENRTVELRESVEEYLRSSMALSVIATTTTANGGAATTMANMPLGDFSTSDSPSSSRPVSAVRSKTGRPQSSPSVSRTVSMVRSSKTRASRFTVTDESLLAMTVKDATAAGLVPSPAVARAVQVAKTSIIRQRVRAQRVTTPLTPSSGGGGASTPSHASTFNKPHVAPSAVTRDDLLDAGISPAALALCDAYESASGVASRIASGVSTSAEANLVKLQAFYKKVHPNNLLRIHEEISRNMGINTAELAFVEQRLVADITKAVEGISKVVETDIEANNNDMGDMGGASNSVLGGSTMQLSPIRKQAGFVSFGGGSSTTGGGGGGFAGIEAHMSSSLVEQHSTSTMEGSMSTGRGGGSPLTKATSINHLEAFLSNGATTTGSNANYHNAHNQTAAPSSNTKIAVDTVARLCASTIGPALTERLPPVALLVLTLYCCSQQDVAHLFPSLEGQEAEALAEMEMALQERKREEGIMKAARRTSNSDGNTNNNGNSPSSKKKSGAGGVDGVLEEIKLLQLRRVLLERVKEAEKRKAHEYESGFRNIDVSHGGGVDGADPNGDGDGDMMITGEESMLSPSSPASYLLSPGSTSGFRTTQAEVARLEMESLHTPFYQESGQPRAVVTITRSLEELRLAVQTAGVTTVLGGRKGLPTTVPTTNNTDIILGKWAGTVTVLVAAIHTITTACETASRAPPPRPASGAKTYATSSPTPTAVDSTRLARRRTTTIRATSPDYKGAPVFKAAKVNPASLLDPIGFPLGYYLQRAYTQVMAILPTISTSSITPQRGSSLAMGMFSGGGGGRMSLAVDMSAGTSGGSGLLSSGAISSALLSASTAAASPPRISAAATASAFTGGTSSIASINLSPFVSPGAATLAHLVAMVGCVTPSRYLNTVIKGWITTTGGGFNFGNSTAMSSSDLSRKNPAAATHPASSIPPEKDTLGNNLLSSGYLPVRYRVLSSSPPAAMDYFRRASLDALRGTFMPPLLCPMTSNADVFSSSSTLPIQMEFAEPVPSVLFDAAASEEDRMHALFDGWHVSKQPTLEELEALLAADARGKQKAPSGKAGSSGAVATDSATLEMKIQAMTAAIANASAASGGDGTSTKKPSKKSKKSEGPLPMTPEEEEVYLGRIPSHVIIELWVRPDIHSVPMSLLFSSRPHEEEFLLSPLLRYRIKRIDIPNMTLQLLVDTSPRQEELDGSGSVVTFFKEVMLDATKASNTARRLCDRLISEFVPKYHCHRHPSQKYAFFCRTCRLLICLGCAREQHAAHMVSSLPYFCHNEAVRMHPNIDSLMARVTRLREVISDLKPKVLSLTDVVDKGMVGVEERLRVHQASLHVDADVRASQQLRQILNEKRRCLEEKANILRTKQALLLLQRGASKAVPKALVPQTYFQISCRLSLALPSGDISKLIKVLTWSNPSKYLSPLIYPPPEAKLHTLEAVDNALAYAAASGNSDEVITVTATEAQAGGGGDGSGGEEAGGGGARGVVTKRVPLTTTGSIAASLVPTGSIGIGDERNIRLTVAGISARITALTRQAEEALSAVWADVTASAEMRGDIAKSDEILLNGAAEAFILVDEADE